MTYLPKSNGYPLRLQTFAGEAVVQNLNNNPAPKTPGFYGSPTRGQLTESMSVSMYNNSMYVSQQDYNREKDSFRPQETVPQANPKDLGEDFVRILLDEFKRVRQISTKDPKVLLDFWKINKKSRQREADVLNKSARGTAKSNQSFISQASQTSERLRELQGIAKEREEDVEYTLSIHSEILKQEDKMKQFILDGYRQRKMEEELKKNQKPKKVSKETMERLYKAPVPNPERAFLAQSNTRQKTMQTMQTTLRGDYDEDFMKRLTDEHYKATPLERPYLTQDVLFSYWQGMTGKAEAKLNKPEPLVREDIHNYFEEKYDAIQELHVAKYGYKTFKPKVLLTFYKNEITDADKKKREIEFEPHVLEKPLEAYCAKRKREDEEYQERMDREARKRAEEERAKLSKAVIKKEIKATGLDKLAKPKDKLMKGKTMLFLKKMFPNDRILQRMLLTEFKKNKLLKYPEEYDIYDSDDEMDTYKRDELREPFKTVLKRGKALQIKDLEKPFNEREKEITEPFRRYLEQKYLDASIMLRKEEQKKTNEESQDKQINRFIAVRVRKYLNMRKRRLYDKIPTLKEFLVQTYKEMHRTYKEATERRFPHITYGYSKRLKRASYPIEFKRYFFLLVRAISRGTKMSHGKNLLPFWAPPSAGAKAYVFLNTNKSYNKRVNDLSKETKIKKIESDTDKVTCWQKDEFFETRLNFMMTLSDAKECTFTPNVGTKMPNKYKELMKHEYGAWASQYLTGTKASFDQWVDAMGSNFTTKFPTIYKYGKFKRALRFWKETQYIKAYKEIAESFNITSIKKHFNPSFDPSKFNSVMFGKDNLKLENDSPKGQEDFSDLPNERFLEDVYILLMFLESHEQDLKKSIKNYQTMISQDRARSKSRFISEKDRSKTMMCPLHGECHEDIRPRWPNTNTKTITKFGSTCEYAHHTFELKFKEEMRAKKKMLNKTLEGLHKKLGSDYEKPPFNPGGANFTGCIGCGEELRTKGVSKGICSSCQLRKTVNKKLEGYRQKAALKYFKITSNDKFEKTHAEKKNLANQLKVKMGYYRRACVLYENERYPDAFANICKAVELVIEEKREEEDKEQKKSNELKAQLGIDPSINLTMDMLNEKESQDPENDFESMYGISKAKLKIYAEKMGYIGEQKIDVNEFLNNEIEEAYLKIERSLQTKQKDISRLQRKIEKLEGFEEDDEETEAHHKAFMSTSLSAKRRQEKALKPKGKFDIDLVGDERRIANMQKTIQYIKNDMSEGNPPEAWKPTRFGNVILEIDKYDDMMSSKNQKKAPGEKPKDLNASSRMDKDTKRRSIFDRDPEELLKMPSERTTPMNF